MFICWIIWWRFFEHEIKESCDNMVQSVWLMEIKNKNFKLGIGDGKWDTTGFIGRPQ